MDQAGLEREARLAAIELLLQVMFADQMLRQPDPLEALAGSREAMRNRLSRETIAGADPAQADHAIGEVELAVAALLDGVEETLVSLLRPR